MATDQAAPLVRLDNADAVNAPSLSYNVPDPTSFPGRSYITLEFGEITPFTTETVVPALGSRPPLSVRAADGGSFERDEPSFDDDDTGPGTHDPAEPSVVVRILEPAEGTTFVGGSQGVDLLIRVRATSKHTWQSAPAAIVTVNDTDVRAPRSAEPFPAVREYAVTVRARPGPVTISARVTVENQSFQVMAPRVVQVNATTTGSTTDTTAPVIALSSPAQGLVLLLSASGTATLDVRGEATDAESNITTCAVALDDGVSQEVTLAADGSFSAQLLVSSMGDHVLTLSTTNQAGLSSRLMRQFVVRAAPRIPRHRLMLVECLRLSNFLGRYGAGRIVQTFSLLPGEKTSITIRTFSTTSQTATETSSVFDSFSETTGDELTAAINNEDTTRSQSEQDLKASVNVKAGATWGWGSASVEAGLAYGTSSAREQLTKNVTNGATRHALEKSSKRDVKVDTTKTVTTTSENEETIVRSLENTSVSRTLNFVFRQMTHEFISLLHLVDVRVAHMTEWFELDGSRSMITPDLSRPAIQRPRIDYEEVALPQLDVLLARICVSPEAATRTSAVILRQLDATFDYLGEWHQVVEEVTRQVPSRDPVTARIRTKPDPDDPTRTIPVTEPVTWTRFDPNLTMSYEPDGRSTGGSRLAIDVPGVILGVTSNTLRTDGIFVDAFLGGGLGLDAYGVRLQSALARRREAEASGIEAGAERVTEAIALVKGNDADRARVFETVFAPGADQHPQVEDG